MSSFRCCADSSGCAGLCCAGETAQRKSIRCSPCVTSSSNCVELSQGVGSEQKVDLDNGITKELNKMKETNWSKLVLVLLVALVSAPAARPQENTKLREAGQVRSVAPGMVR